MMGWLPDWWGGGGGTAVVEPATPRDAARLAQLHGASFHRGWGEGEFEVMLTERNTLVHRLRLGRRVIGFAVSRMAADEAELLSIAIDAILNQKETGVICIYVAIAQKESTTAALVDVLRRNGALDYTIVVVASSAEPARRGQCW